MVWYDFVILAILAYTTWQGAQRGLVSQLAWIAALVLCFKFADKFAPAIEGQINVEQPLKHWIAMFILYLGFSLGSFMVARILHSWMEKAKFKDFDRHLGGILGLVKGLVIAMVITFFALTLSESLKGVVLTSNSGKAACYILDTVEPITPEYFHEYLAKYQDELAHVHESHLGDAGPIDDLFPGGSSPSEGSSGGGFSLPNLVGGLMGEKADSPGSPNSISGTRGPTMDEMLRSLTPEIRSRFGNELQQQWNIATPEQRQGLLDSLGRSFETEVPGVLSKFMNSLSGQSRVEQGSTDSLLASIGDIYQNRELIVQRSREHFAGVPAAVQKAVLEDWYADLKLQADPDPATNIESRLDDRIIRQLERAQIPFRSLSSSLQQRLNQSLR